MRRPPAPPLLLLVLLSCAAPNTRYVTSRDFSFRNYDNLVLAKSGEGNSATLYGMDIELANRMASYNFTILGDKELAQHGRDRQQRTLNVRFFVASNEAATTLTIAFDDFLSGRTVASFTQTQDGDIADADDRQRILESVTTKITTVAANDKGLTVTGK